MKVLYTALLVAGLIAGCSPSNTEYKQATDKAQQLEKQVAELKAELEEIKYGPEKLIVTAETQINQKEFLLAKKTIELLLDKHASAPQAIKAKPMLAEAEQGIKQQQEAEEQAKKKAKEQAEKEVARIMANMKRNTDEIKEITWVRHKLERPLSKKVALYFGTRNNKTAGLPLRMIIQYSGGDWLFANSVTIKADDKVINLGELDFERDHSSGSVWEWADIPADHAHLEDLLNAKRVVVRFDGDKYYSDFTWPVAQQTQAKEVFTAWKTLP
jgi:hypothetical protein